MNKWLKYTLIAGVSYVGAKEGYKYLKQSAYIQSRLDDLKQVKEYNDLRKAILEVIDAFNKKETIKIESSQSTDEHQHDFKETVYENDDATIGEAVKRVLDTPVVSQLFSDPKDVELMKDLIDETKEVEKLIRGWFN